MDKGKFFLDKTSTAFKILELSGEMYVLTDANNTIVDCSNRLSTLSCRPIEKIIGESLHVLFQVDSQEEFSTIFGGYHQYINGKYIQQLPFIIKDGRTIPALVTAYQNNKDLGLDDINCFFIQELSDNKLDNDVLEIKKMFQNVLDTIPARIFWKDKDLNFLGCNNKFAQDAGIKAGEKIFGKSDFDLAWKKEEAEFYRSMDRRVIESGISELDIIEPQLNAEGDETWLETNKSPLLNVKGEIIGVLGTYTDITHRKKNEDIIKKHSRDLEIKNKELEQFAHITSHDLQEPLRSLSSFVELLSTEYHSQLDETGKTYLNYINDSASRMRNLITCLLEYSLLSREIENETVDCNTLVQEIMQDLSYMVNNTQTKIHIDPLPVIFSKPTQLRIVFQNIIQNAMKFKKRNTAPEISISVINTGEYWKFKISDNGIGFNQSYSEKIFSLFQRLHNKNDYEGSGIGLAYCKKIIDLLGGEIWVESKETIGSTFYFTLKKEHEHK